MRFALDAMGTILLRIILLIEQAGLSNNLDSESKIILIGKTFYDMLKRRELLDDFFHRYNYEAIGGSPILGINGTAIIGHGLL